VIPEFTAEGAEIAEAEKNGLGHFSVARAFSKAYILAYSCNYIA